jgi:ABC-type glutathione transport system ATPase component
VQRIADGSLVVLVGPSASGKTTWADAHFRPEEVVSSDRLRALLAPVSATSPAARTRSRSSTSSSPPGCVEPGALDRLGGLIGATRGRQ